MTENTQSLSLVREGDSRFRALVTATSDVVYSMSPDWSRMQFLDGKGFLSDTDEASQDWLSRYIHPDDQPRVLETIDRAVRTKTPFDLEHRVRRVDGSLGWTHSRAIPLFDADGNVVEWFGAASDVTQARKAQEELFNERQRLQALLHALPIGVSYTDSVNCERIVGNAALLEQFGGTIEDAVSASAVSVGVYGRQVLYSHQGKPVHANDLPLQRAAREGCRIGPVELEVQLPTGRRFTLEASAAPVRGVAGEVVGAVATSADITERKRAAKAREETRAKDEFLATLGHELRNPLAAISTVLDLVGEDTSSVQRSSTDNMIRNQVAVIRRLVDDLLDLSRMTLGTTRLKKLEVSMTDLLQSAATAIMPRLRERGQNLVLDIEAPELRFVADPVRLQQILGNLLDNACKYSGRGQSIELSGRLDGEDVVLRCKDSGQGIPTGMLDKIFEPMIRLEPGRAAAPGGLGIGLALVRQLAQLHGGSASAVSDGPGKGTAFTVRFPYELANGPQKQAARAAIPSKGGQRLSVALVDDNPDVSSILALAMERAGHIVRTFPDGPSALAVLPDSAPDVVLIDYGLPGMSGLELLRRLREHANLRETRFIGISGAGVDSVTSDPADRFDHFLPKPVDLKELNALLGGRAAGSAPIRAMLVEDHRQLAHSTVRLLRAEGLEAEAVASAKEAMEEVARMRPQLLLCDMRLPDMPGLELIARLRQQLREWNTCVVVLTAASDSELETYRRQAGELGVHQFIAKPISAATVRDMVSMLASAGRPAR